MHQPSVSYLKGLLEDIQKRTAVKHEVSNISHGSSHEQLKTLVGKLCQLDNLRPILSNAKIWDNVLLVWRI